MKNRNAKVCWFYAYIDRGRVTVSNTANVMATVVNAIRPMTLSFLFIF